MVAGEVVGHLWEWYCERIAAAVFKTSAFSGDHRSGRGFSVPLKSVSQMLAEAQSAVDANGGANGATPAHW